MAKSHHTAAALLLLGVPVGLVGWEWSRKRKATSALAKAEHGVSSMAASIARAAVDDVRAVALGLGSASPATPPSVDASPATAPASAPPPAAAATKPGASLIDATRSVLSAIAAASSKGAEQRSAATRPAPTAAHPPLGRRLTTSTPTADGVEPTDLVLWAQARAVDPTITLDELAAARLIASELGDTGRLVEWCCVVDAEANRAQRAGKGLYASLTRGFGFGHQGAHRPASTRLDPHEGHLVAARLVLSGEARGIARGAVRFFDPETEDRLAAAWAQAPGKRPRSCDAMTILERWSFDRPWKPGAACALDRARTGRDTEAWVGPISGVDPWRLMLFAPMPVSNPLHAARYQQAVALIERARAGKAVS